MIVIDISQYVESFCCDTMGFNGMYTHGFTWVCWNLMKFGGLWMNLSEFDGGWWDLMPSCLLRAFSFQNNGDHFGVNPEGCNFIVRRNCFDIRGSNSIVHLHHASTMRFAHAWALKCGNRMFPYKIGTSHGRSLQNWNPLLTNETMTWYTTKLGTTQNITNYTKPTCAPIELKPTIKLEPLKAKFKQPKKI